MNACKTAKSRQAFGQTNRQTDKEIFKQKELRERDRFVKLEIRQCIFPDTRKIF